MHRNIPNFNEYIIKLEMPKVTRFMVVLKSDGGKTSAIKVSQQNFLIELACVLPLNGTALSECHISIISVAITFNC